MAIDIPEIAAKNAKKAFEIARSALQEVTVRLTPQGGEYDPETDETTGRTWLLEKQILALVYDESEKEDRSGPRVTMKAFLVLGEGLGTHEEHEEGEIDYQGRTWNISMVESDPTKTVFIFYSKR